MSDAPDRDRAVGGFFVVRENVSTNQQNLWNEIAHELRYLAAMRRLRAIELRLEIVYCSYGGNLATLREQR